MQTVVEKKKVAWVVFLSSSLSRVLKPHETQFLFFVVNSSFAGVSVDFSVAEIVAVSLFFGDVEI